MAKRALKAGLQPSQIKVYGLPVRPSFVKPVRPKVCFFFFKKKLSQVLALYRPIFLYTPFDQFVDHASLGSSVFVFFICHQDVLRRELGMDEDLPAVLLMGGGEGMGPIEATAQALGNTLYDENLGQPIGQILVICGRNKRLYNRLQSIDWKVPVQVS